MTISIRKQLGTSLANHMLREIQHQKSNYYYFLGKLNPWSVDDESPTTAQSLSEYEDMQIRNNAAYFKKITPNDVTLVCKRTDWVSGTVYSQWDNTVDMENKNFFVLTSDNRVYKCLYNNGNIPSTDKPIYTYLQPFYTSDGYLWKYMYTVPTFKKTRFTSYNYIPVQTAMSDSFYGNGSINSVVILNSGSGYIDQELTYITVSGSTTGAGASASIGSVNLSGGLTSISSLVGGSGYTRGATISVNSSTGQGAIVAPVIIGGIITELTIVSPGAGYSVSDTISITVGGAVLIPSISEVTGSIENITIINPGTGYTAPPTLTVNTVYPVSVNGLYSGNSSAILEAVVDNGSIQRILIKDPGIGYPTATDTQIIVSGDGTGLRLSPVITNGELVDVIIEDPGVGYTNVTLSVIGSGTGVTIRPIFNDSDYYSDQSIVEQVAVNGAIYAINVTSNGSGYSQETTTVEIIGDGTGATATATVFGGGISKITMTSFGSGYTYATVVIADSSRDNSLNTFIDASAYAILPPIGGHGKNAVSELFGRTLAISSSIRSDPILLQYSQDYRQFGLIHSPKNLTTGKPSTVDYTFNVYKVSFQHVINLIIDEILLLDSNEYVVVYIENSIVYLQELNGYNIDPIGTLIAKSDPLRTYTADTLIQKPIINKYSGELLISSNENPFEFSQTQGLLIKTYIKF